MTQSQEKWRHCRGEATCTFQGEDKSRAYWPAGSKAIARVDPFGTVSISPLDNKVAKRFGFAKIEVDSRMKDEGNKAEEAKGQKDKDEGIVG